MPLTQCYNSHNKKWVVRENGKIKGNFDEKQENIPVLGEACKTTEPAAKTEPEPEPENNEKPVLEGAQEPAAVTENKEENPWVYEW